MSLALSLTTVLVMMVGSIFWSSLNCNYMFSDLFLQSYGLFALIFGYQLAFSTSISLRNFLTLSKPLKQVSANFTFQASQNFSSFFQPLYSPHRLINNRDRRSTKTHEDLPHISSNPYKRMLTNSTIWDTMEEIYSEQARIGDMKHLF